MSHDLRPASHINAMIAKAHERANAIHRAFVSRDISLLVRAFLVYVRPIVEYNIFDYNGRHILSKTLKQLKMYKDDSLKDFPGLRNFHIKRDLDD